MTEKYEPTAEELKEGEEAMTRDQRELSKKGQNVYENYDNLKKELGVEGDIHFIPDDERRIWGMTGDLNGHKFELFLHEKGQDLDIADLPVEQVNEFFADGKAVLSGNIDGISVSELQGYNSEYVQVLHNLWKKYFSLALAKLKVVELERSIKMSNIHLQQDADAKRPRPTEEEITMRKNKEAERIGLVQKDLLS